MPDKRKRPSDWWKGEPAKRGGVVRLTELQPGKQTVNGTAIWVGFYQVKAGEKK